MQDNVFLVKLVPLGLVAWNYAEQDSETQDSSKTGV